MSKWWIFPISLLVCVACATPTTTVRPVSQGTPDAAATLAAVESVRHQAANAATVQAADLTRQAALATQQAGFSTATTAAITTGTAQHIAQAQTATADRMTLRITEQALASQGTLSAIAANATGTAVANLASAEQHLVEDEARRLGLQREAEAADLAYRQQMNQIKPYLWGGVVLAIVILTSSLAYGLYQRSRPMTVTDDNGPRVLIPANGWQVLPPRSSTSRSLPEPQSLAAETNVTSIPLPPLAQGHVLIAGETGSGKSTAMLAVLQRRPFTVVLDPHATPGSWGNAQVIGGGRDFTAIGSYMQQMRRLLSTRYSQRASGTTHFDPLTVATDEMPAIVAALGRQVDEVWREWLREGRKVGLFFVVSTQSTRVKTLGIRGEGDLLQNFSYVLMLGKLAIDQYPDLVQTQEWPAVLRTIRGSHPVTVPLTSGAQPRQSSEIPLFIAPAPNMNAAGFADPNDLTAQTRQRIRQLARELSSQAAVERVVFGYNGGAAYRAVKQVLTEAENNDSNGSTTTSNI